MIAKIPEKKKAIELRKQGLSYNEILNNVSVAKSTLSLWLRDVGLAKRQKQRLTEKRRIAQLKGSQVKRQQRLDRSKDIKYKALNEIGKITQRELKLLGSALYWAEGARQKETNVSERVAFSNSDPYMIMLFLQWLKKICQVNNTDIKLDLFIHESGDLAKAKKFWGNSLRIKPDKFRVYFKRHRRSTRRKNVGENYNGLIRISVKRSTDLNRKISGWIEGIYRGTMPGGVIG